MVSNEVVRADFLTNIRHIPHLDLLFTGNTSSIVIFLSRCQETLITKTRYLHLSILGPGFQMIIDLQNIDFLSQINSIHSPKVDSDLIFF